MKQITLRNTPFFTRRGETQGKRYTFANMVAQGAAKEVETRLGDKYSEGSYWAGYRDAFRMICRLIEGTIDSSSNLAIASGLELYNEWLGLQEAIE